MITRTLRDEQFGRQHRRVRPGKSAGVGCRYQRRFMAGYVVVMATRLCGLPGLERPYRPVLCARTTAMAWGAYGIPLDARDPH
jgi:hypothetical protein